MKLRNILPDRPWDPSHRFQTSWLLPPLWLAVVRTVLGLYVFATLLAVIAWDCTHPTVPGHSNDETDTASNHGCAASRHSFSYFTVLTYWGLAGYLLAAAVYTAAYARLAPHRATATSSRLTCPPRELQVLHDFVYSSVVVFPFIVTAVYWGFLYTAPSTTTTTTSAVDTWRNVSQHALNAVFALVEIVLPRTERPPWLHLPGLLVVLAIYLAVAYITRASTGLYVYRFLDPSLSGAGSRLLVAAYIVGIAIFCCVVFCLVQGLIALRLWLTEPTPKKLLMHTADLEMGNVKE